MAPKEHRDTPPREKDMREPSAREPSTRDRDREKEKDRDRERDRDRDRDRSRDNRYKRRNREETHRSRKGTLSHVVYRKYKSCTKYLTYPNFFQNVRLQKKSIPWTHRHILMFLGTYANHPFQFWRIYYQTSLDYVQAILQMRDRLPVNLIGSRTNTPRHIPAGQ